ncbi:nuclear transport factor 2 family protein [Breoghania sp.]|uniref:nuclear transport factor 2 family protein n=1 Tax=Breoghania sp. TaxID=2065378 RepID=UPI002615426A|nr:nuclear transport factor 2 family protein [Breoghania sp.]MDJ0932802.1 nuclear transport factor 2 family protein [Breoghania sp.]
MLVLNGRAAIEANWAPFLATFEKVFHMNGQFSAKIDGNTATAVHYCLVELVGTEDGKMVRNSNGVIYNDSYVRRDGLWLIAKRVARFTWRDLQPYHQA